MPKARRARGFRTTKNIKELNESEDPQNRKTGLCITDLPSSIAIGILSILPLNCVLICRCVCKTWRNLIKDSEFVKLHFSRAQPYPLIRPVGRPYISRILYFVDQPPKSNPFNEDCESHLNIKLGTKLKIPLHNAELAMNGKGEPTTSILSKRKRVTKLRPKNHKLNLVNSCNGFLCLSEPLHNDPVMVCNPVTGEFIKLPGPTKSWKDKHEVCDSGLGFCPKTSQYKVVRMFTQEGREMNVDPITGRATPYCKVAEIHTLGTDTWKNVGYAPSPIYELRSPTYLNDTLNWLYLSTDHPYFIAAFDFDNEKFQSIPIPPKSYDHMSGRDKGRISIGNLRGCLCICDASDKNLEEMELWVMKIYGDESSWIIEFRIDLTTSEGTYLRGIYEPMSYFKDGTLLFFHPASSALFSYNFKENNLKFLKVHGIKTQFQAIAYIPSFISLKDALTGDLVKVYDVKSRCGGLKLQLESKVVSLVEENADLASDFNTFSEDEMRGRTCWWIFDNVDDE